MFIEKISNFSKLISWQKTQVFQRLENFDLVESLNVQVRKVFMDTLIITQVLEDLKVGWKLEIR